MKKPANVRVEMEVVRECAYCRLAGSVTLDQAVDLVEQAIAYARDRRIPKLFANAAGLVGFPSPTLPERYFIARKFAATAQGQVQMALVLRPEIIEPEKFGIMVARNAGMNVDVFASEPEALAWLSPEPDKTSPPSAPSTDPDAPRPRPDD